MTTMSNDATTALLVRRTIRTSGTKKKVCANSSMNSLRFYLFHLFNQLPTPRPYGIPGPHRAIETFSSCTHAQSGQRAAHIAIHVGHWRMYGLHSFQMHYKQVFSICSDNRASAARVHNRTFFIWRENSSANLLYSFRRLGFSSRKLILAYFKGRFRTTEKIARLDLEVREVSHTNSSCRHHQRIFIVFCSPPLLVLFLIDARFIFFFSPLPTIRKRFLAVHSYFERRQISLHRFNVPPQAAEGAKKAK